MITRTMGASLRSRAKITKMISFEAIDTPNLQLPFAPKHKTWNQNRNQESKSRDGIWKQKKSGNQAQANVPLIWAGTCSAGTT